MSDPHAQLLVIILIKAQVIRRTTKVQVNLQVQLNYTMKKLSGFLSAVRVTVSYTFVEVLTAKWMLC